MDKIKLLAPKENQQLPLLDAVQLAYLASDRKNRKSEIQFINMQDPCFRERDRSRPLPVVFCWYCEQVPEEDFLLEISTNPDFREVRSIHVPCFLAGDDARQTIRECYGRYDVRNLIPGTEYFWRVSAGRDVTSPAGVFRTEDRPPRLIAMPDMVNVRDIGGWKSSFGGKIAYGKMYRGCSLDTIAPISPAGEDVFLKELKIRTELDLRGPDAGLALPGVEQKIFTMHAYASWGENGIFKETQRKNIHDIFELLDQEKRMPFYCHCAGGSDRTGTVILLLEAMLGVCEEDLCTDYELTTLSCLGERSRNNEQFQGFLQKLHEFGGKDITECVERYLTDCGITESQMQSLRKKWLMK